MDNQINIKSNIQDYSVFFVDSFVEHLKQDLDANSALIIDQNVHRLYAEKLNPVLQGKKVMVVEALETNKTMGYSREVIKFLMENGFKRNHSLIAMGGGIIQDLTCFIASILFRGVAWKFYPTTLLAQCDSCIGSKSSINVDQYKNMVGGFYPPKKIVIDVHFTQTLEHKDLLSGLGEAIKVHYLDPKKRYQPVYDLYQDSIGNLGALNELIHKSLLIKKDVIEVDEYDRDFRNIMNYGHTFGHALESITNYAIPHGIAVTHGMGMANRLSRQIGFLSEEECQQMQTLIDANTQGEFATVDKLDGFWEALRKDKKNVDSRVNFILTKGYGLMMKHKMELDETVKSVVRDYLKMQNIYVG